MRRRGAAWASLGAVLVMAGGCDALGGEKAGFGTPEVRTLAEPGIEERFAGEPVEISARLAALPNGCLVAVVDGVEHVVFWPDGTEAVDSRQDPGSYTVTLPGGTTLHAGEPDSGGDAFTAAGVLAQGDGVIAVDPEVPTDDYVGSYLTFCGVEAPPVAFWDAETFVLTG